jgi:hypothetical protein
MIKGRVYEETRYYDGKLDSTPCVFESDHDPARESVRITAPNKLSLARRLKDAEGYRLHIRNQDSIEIVTDSHPDNDSYLVCIRAGIGVNVPVHFKEFAMEYSRRLITGKAR